MITRRDWVDPRDGASWTVWVESKAAEVVSGAVVQMLVFRGEASARTAYYEGSRELDELSDADLCGLLDSAP